MNSGERARPAGLAPTLDAVHGRPERWSGYGGRVSTQPEVVTEVDVASAGRYVMKKLPEVTLAFWIMKIAATTLGETAGDLFSQTLRLGYFLTTIALFVVFVVTLIVQLRSRHYNPFFYWTVILSTSMAGTTMSDFMNRDASDKYLAPGTDALGWGPQGLGLGYPTGAAILISVLIAIFAIWKASGLTFAIADINTFRGEALFWAAILVSNTLGTSMGDFLSDSSGLGYAGGALLVAGLLAVLLAFKYVPSVSNVLLFWLAFVLTRPLGATAGDFLTKPISKGGLALGTFGSSLVLLALLFGLMAWARIQQRRTASDVTSPQDRGADDTGEDAVGDQHGGAYPFGGTLGERLRRRDHHR